MMIGWVICTTSFCILNHAAQVPKIPSRHPTRLLSGAPLCPDVADPLHAAIAAIETELDDLNLTAAIPTPVVFRQVM